MPVIDELKADPKFLSLSPEAKKIVLAKKDPAFSKISPAGQDIVISKLSEDSSDQEPGMGKRLISSFARPALEVGGAMGGAALAAPGGPVTAAAGGVLGFAAGKGAADRVDEVLGLKQAPQTLAEGAKETVQGVKEGAIQEATGLGIGKALTVGSKPFAEEFAQGGQKLIDKAKSFDVELTPAEATKSKPLSMLESVLDKIPFSSGIIQRFRGKQAQQLEDAAESLIRKVGSVETKEGAGQAVQSAIEAKFQKRLTVRDKLFDRMTQSVPKDAVVPTTNLQETAQRLLSNEDQLPAGFQNSGVSTVLTDAAKLREQGLSFKGTKALRERLNQLIGDRMDTPEKFIYAQLKGSLDKDIADFSVSQGGKIEASWKKANQFHGAVKTLADDPNIKKVVNSNPEKVVDLVFRPGAVTEAKLLRKAVGENDFRKVQRAAVNRLFDGSANQTPSQALVSNLKKYGQDTLNSVIPKETLNSLKDFAEVASASLGAEKRAGNPSGTAQNLITFGQGAFFITNPVKGTIAVLAPPAIAKMYLSESGRSLLTEGLKMPIGSKAAASLAGRIASMAKVYDSQDSK